MAPALHTAQQQRPAATAARLSSRGFLQGVLLPAFPSGHLPAVNSRPCAAIALQSLRSSSQPLCFLVDLHPCPGYIGPQHRLSVWFSFHSDRHRLAPVLSDSLKCFPSVPTDCPNVGLLPLLQLPHLPSADLILLFPLLIFPSFLHPTKFCVDLHIPFGWSGTPASLQIMLRGIFCL